MATYPLEVAPPLLRAPEGRVVSEDQLLQHSQAFFQGADIVWVTISACLVLQMIPALSMFYAGAVDRSSTLTLLRMPVVTAAFCAVQWYLWGYSLTFSPSHAENRSPWHVYGGQVQDLVLYRALVRPVGAAGPKIPELLYAFYQGMFACFTPALICGGVIKKFRAGRFLAFILLWSLLVYYPVARWTWSPEGFSSQHGVMDFSGGTAVHITSGTAVGAVVLFDAVERHGWGVFAHAWAIIYPKPTPAPPVNVMTIRREDSGLSDEASPTAPASNMNTTASPRSSTGDPKLTPEIPSHPPSPRVPTPAPPSARMLTSQTVFPHMLPAPQLDPSAILGDDAPHSLNNMILGTLQLWFGWFGFNGGSALGGNLRAVSACISTHVSASSGACTMLLLHWALQEAVRQWPKLVREGRRGAKVSVVHFCDGAIVGLVAITPAAGYVPVWSAGCIGAIASAVIFFLKSTVLLDLMRSDPLFIFLIHTGGGFIGMVLTGCFARQYVVGFDGYSTIRERSTAGRLGWQVADALMGFGWSMAMTLGTLLLLKVVISVANRKWTRLFDVQVDEKLQAELEYKERIE